MYDQCLPGIDFRMGLQHGTHIINNLLDPGGIIVAHTDMFIDAAIAHARGVFHGDIGKGCIRHVQRALIEGTNARQTPANMLNRAFNLLVR